ncbi:MAG: tetratricopeptide repeat protein [Deltaproteobacteria bacterium]|nr:tetratricopeptide repeat protein [Deltaproteobacteria bacterium]
MEDKGTKGSILFRWLPVLFIPAGLLLYLNALKAPFVYDDRGFIIFNPVIRSLNNFLAFSGTRYLGFLSFALNYRLGGLHPFGFHLVNVLIHIMNAALVFYFLRLTCRTPSLSKFAGAGRPASVWLPFIASVIFLAHPVQTQAVAYVTQRFASMATLFYILSMVLYIKARLSFRAGGGVKAWLVYSAAFLSAVLAMKTKEITFTLPFAILIYDIVFFRTDEPADRLRRAPFYLLILFIPLSIVFSSGDPVTENLRNMQLNEAVTLRRGDYIYTQFSVILTYIRLLLYPVGQKIEYDYPLSTSLMSAGTLIPLLALVSLAVFALHVLRRSYREKDPYGLLFSFGIFWFFLTLSVESFMVPIQDVIFEQRIYLPGLGLIISSVSAFYLAVNGLRKRGLKVSEAAASIAALIIVCPPLFASTYARNMVWRDELKLLDESIGDGSSKPRLYYIRAMVHLDRNEAALALKDARMAVKLEPHSAEMQNILGFANLSLGQYAESIEDFNRAIQDDPAYYMAYFNRAHSYAYTKRYDEAVLDYGSAIRLRPGLTDAYNDRGVVYSILGESGKARSDLEAACSKGSDDGCKNLRSLSRTRH